MFKEVKPRTDSKNKTEVQNLCSYAEACNTAQNFDWAAEILYGFF